MAGLKACPFCGGGDCGYDNTQSAVMCFDCLSAGPENENHAEAIAAWNTRPRDPLLDEARDAGNNWGGLARAIMMWMDIHEAGEKTPRNLFKHLERTGQDVPQWLRDEYEMMALDHVPSKGTRCYIIWRAMMTHFLAKLDAAK